MCFVQASRNGSHLSSALTDVMIQRPCELFHMDLDGPARVCPAEGSGTSL
jgi:hypothetical protein